MTFVGEYLLFAAKTATVVVALLLLAVGLAATARRARGDNGTLQVRDIGRRYERMARIVEAATLPKHEFRRLWRGRKRRPGNDRRIFVIDFKGDIRASTVSSLRHEITALLASVRSNVARYRQGLDIDRVATGEYCYGERAVALGLVDGLRTSDDYLLDSSGGADVYQVRYVEKDRKRRWRIPIGLG